jgi:hypothetical protein
MGCIPSFTGRPAGRMEFVKAKWPKRLNFKRFYATIRKIERLSCGVGFLVRIKPGGQSVVLR